MNRERLGAIVASIGRIAGTLGVPGADIVGMTFKDLLGQQGIDTTGMSNQEILVAAEEALEAAEKERDEERDGLAEAIRKRREARGD